MSDYKYLKETPDSEEEWFSALVMLARYLRTPEGCPWDREQTAADFARYLAEETQELREALDGSDVSHAEEEWGDVFFTLMAAGAAAEEQGLFTVDNAFRRIHEKMIRRHEHVFGEVKAATPEEAVEAWEAAKRREKDSA